MKYVCGHCGSDDIEVKAWVKANTDEIVDWCDDDVPNCWCNHCNGMSRYRSIEEK